MIEYAVEQFLPCNLSEITATIKRKVLPTHDAPVYITEELVAYPMNEGFYVEGRGGQFYIDSLDLLQSIHGKSVNDVCNNQDDLRELEQYYHHGIIGYEATSTGKITLQNVNKKYFGLYQDTETTWYSYIPLKMEIDLTKICNLTCKHCSRDASPSQNEQDMTLQDYVDLIERAGHIGVPSLSFMGGEPTCHPEFIELAVIAKVSGVRHLSTSTNGWLIDEERAQKMASLFNSIQVSLHGATSETHDSIVGKPGAFLRACNAAQLFKENDVGFLNIAFTVMKENAHEMPSMVHCAQQMDADSIRFLVLFAEGRGKLLDQWSNDEKEEISNSIKGLRQQYKEFITVEAGGFPPYCGVKPDAAFYGCPAGRTLLYVGADGEVKPCSNLPFSLGKIQEVDILDLWHSAEMVALRKRPPCTCSYTAICAGGCLGNPYWLKAFIKKGGDIRD